MRTKLWSTKTIFIDRCELIFREPFIQGKGQENKKYKNFNLNNRAKYYYIIIISLLYTWKNIFILKKFFFFFICQFVFHRVHDLFKEFIISYFVRVICWDSTNAKWVFNHVRWFFKQFMPSAIQLTISSLDGNQQFKLKISNTNKKMTDVMKEQLNPLVQEYRRINSKPK